jgi:hypothetical protein
MGWGARGLLLAAALLLGACGNTGRVVGLAAAGVSAVGSVAVGAAGAVGSAAVGVASVGAQAVGAAGAAVAGGVASVAGAGASAGAGAGAAGSGGAAGAAASAGAAELALGAGTVAGAAAMQDILHQAGREGSDRAKELLAAQRPASDRCALQMFLGVAGEFGYAQGARFALWFSERVRAEGQRNAFAGALMVADSMAREITLAARDAQLVTAEWLGFEDEDEMRHTLAVANDLRTRCPAGAAGRMAALLTEEE